MHAILSLLRGAWLEQKALARELLSDPRTRAPFETVCLAAFGSSLHEAVTSYFYLGLGATASDIGTIGSITLIVGVVANPLIGLSMDLRGASGAMIAASLACGAGCLLRGLSTRVAHLLVSAAVLGVGGGSLELSVATYLSAVLGPTRRSSVLSGLVAQTGALRLAAKAAFPMLARALAAAFPYDELSRFRVALSLCWIFCFYGVVRISYSRHQRHLILGPLGTFADGYGSRAKVARVDSSDVSLEDGDVDSGQRHVDGRAKGPYSFADSTPFLLAALAVSATAMSTTIITILWPLIVRDRFGWGAEEYSVLVLLAAVGRVMVTPLVPQFERRVGHVRAVLAVSSVAIVAVLALVGVGARTVRDGHELKNLDPRAGQKYVDATSVQHTTLVLLHLVALRCLEVMVRSLATLVLPLAWTSRSFGLVATFSALGGIAGSIAGTRLYTVDPMWPLYLSTLLQLVLMVLLATISGSALFSMAPSPTAAVESPTLDDMELPLVPFGDQIT